MKNNNEEKNERFQWILVNSPFEQKQLKYNMVINELTREKFHGNYGACSKDTHTYTSKQILNLLYS